MAQCHVRYCASVLCTVTCGTEVAYGAGVDAATELAAQQWRLKFLERRSRAALGVQGSRVQGPGSRVQGPGSRIQGPGSRVQGLGFRTSGLARGRKGDVSAHGERHAGGPSGPLAGSKGVSDPRARAPPLYRGRARGVARQGGRTADPGTDNVPPARSGWC
eukprot:2090252-Rhodomonas_salina.1